MNFRLTMALVILLALAFSAYLMVPKGPAPAPSGTGATPLLSAKDLDVRTITYLRDGSVEVKFEKLDNDWKMTQPVNARADTFTVGDIARTLGTISYRRKFEPESSGEKSAVSTGTANPHNVVKFTDAANKEYTLAFGYKPPDGIFATFNGDKTVYVLSSNPLDRLDQNPDTFRNKQVKQLDTTKITRLQIKTQTSDVTLTKSDDKWLISSPISGRANSTAVTDMVKEFANIQAAGFSTLDKKTASLDPPLVSVTAWVQNATPTTAPATASAPASQSQPAPAATPVTLQFGVATQAAQPDKSPLYASLADTNEVFTFTRDSFNKFNKEFKDLRDPAVTPAAVTQATEMSLTTDGATTVALAKKDNAWNLTSTTPSLAADPFAVSDYLAVIRDLRAIKYVDNPGDLKSIGLDPPHMKIELAVPGQSQHEVLMIGKPETADAVTPVLRQGEPTIYLLQTKEAEKLLTSPIALRDKDIELLNADKIRKIEIAGAQATPGIPSPTAATAPATSTAPASAPATAAATAPALPPGITLEREGTHWNVKKADAALTPDDSKISTFLAQFTPLAATKYLADKVDVSGTPDITVTMSILEPTMSPATAPASVPAIAPATSTAPASTRASTPATTPSLADVLPNTGAMGPDPGKIETRTLRIYKQTGANNAITWKAVWDTQKPEWTFEPTPALIDDLTKGTFATPTPPTPPATQPATQPASQPAK